MVLAVVALFVAAALVIVYLTDAGPISSMPPAEAPVGGSSTGLPTGP